MMELGERILELRTEKGFTQEELGEKIGVNRQTVSSYERGLRTPNAEQLIILSETFEVTTDYLLGISIEKFPSMDKASAEYTGLNISTVKNLHKTYEACKKKSVLYNENQEKNILYFLICDSFINGKVIDLDYLLKYSTNIIDRNKRFTALFDKYIELKESDFTNEAVLVQDLEDFKKKCFELDKEHQEEVLKIGRKLFQTVIPYIIQNNPGTLVYINAELKTFYELGISAERILGRIEEINLDRERQKRKYRRWHGEQKPYPTPQKL